MTFGDLVIAVARWFGMAAFTDGVWAVPTDARNLEFCRDIVRRGLQRLVNDHPSWRWMRQTHRLVVVSGQDEYEMPWFFSGEVLSDRVTYGVDGPRTIVKVVPEEAVREALTASGGETGDPRMIAFYQPQQETPALAATRRWKALVYPTPTSTRTMEFVIRANPRMPWSLTDSHFAGMTMDHVVLSACRAEAELESSEQAGAFNQRYAVDLEAAKQRDAESGPRILGTCSDAEGDDGWRPNNFGPLTTNGVVVID